MSSLEEIKDMLIANGIADVDAQKLYDENVDEEAFLDLNEDDLKSLGIKLGDRKKIMRIVKQKKIDKEGAITVTVMTSDSNQRLNLSDISIANNDLVLNNGYLSEISGNMTHDSENTIYIPATSTPVPAPVIQNSYNILPFASPETIDIENILNKSPRGQMLLQLFKKPNSEAISRKYVSELVRICVHSMVTDLETLYPTSHQKKNLAKAIVKAFPILKASRENVEGYEHLFDSLSRSGLIEWRLKTLRVKVSPSKKKNRKRTLRSSSENEDEFQEDDASLTSKITWLQYQVPSVLHKTEIVETMQETFRIRRHFIKTDNPSIAAILKKYPKFKDFGGILIDAEFKQMHSAAGDFLAIFPAHYAPRILKYTRQNRMDIYERISIDVDENFRALLMLADLLPIAGFRKKRKVSGNQSLATLFSSDALVRFIGTNGSLEEAMEVIQENQPYLLCAGEKSSQGTFFLILDKEAVDVGQCALKAFDFLYKSHYIFNVKFTEQLSSFYNFMDTMVYKVISGPARSSAENLNIILNAIDTGL